MDFDVDNVSMCTKMTSLISEHKLYASHHTTYIQTSMSHPGTVL